MGHRTVCLLLVVSLLLSACVSKNVRLSPGPAFLEEIEGYASLRISTDEQTSRSRVSFVFALPSRGRLDVLDPLGQVRYQLIMAEPDGFFIIPSKKVYWRASGKEIFEKFFGFNLSLTEVVGLLSGQWQGLEKSSPEENWSFKTNAAGRIRSGQKGSFTFTVTSYFESSDWVKEVAFSHPSARGGIKILNVDFNRPVQESAFQTAFLQDYDSKTWEEIREMLSRAR